MKLETAIRLQLLQAGFVPLPATGKQPAPMKWDELAPNAAEATP